MKKQAIKTSANQMNVTELILLPVNRVFHSGFPCPLVDLLVKGWGNMKLYYIISWDYIVHTFETAQEFNGNTVSSSLYNFALVLIKFIQSNY